ncbi:MAG: HlyD family secretion protein [Caulobacteraceae bacterium]|nr:HlyD family secretion protein [Caulobacteraceae bacterium]
MTATTPDAVAVPARKAGLPFSKRTLIMVSAAVVVALGGATLILMPRNTVSTEAAYVQADSSSVAPRVRGLIAEVLVAHNQAVRKGDPLVRIDPEEFDARVAAAEADLADAEAALLAAHAALTSLGADEALAAANIRSARTSIASADAQNARAQADRQRFDDLLASGTVARRDAEERRAAAVSAQSTADKTRADLEVTRNQAGVVTARREVLTAAVARAEASVARAQAALDLARQDQANTIVRAPIDGIVGDRQAEPGDYVQAGTRLLTVVPATGLYVTANFKETQTGRMRVGQRADIEIDALPGAHLHGVVDSFAPGSGSTFSLLPFEPGTGNFTKVVQRVPVRIRLDPGQPALDQLRSGLSTTVKVTLK